MAEEVEISNVGGENGVASEATLKQLLAAMNKLAGGGAGGAAAEAKARKLANEALKNGTTATNDNTKAQKEETKATEAATKATNELADKMGRLAAQGLKTFATSLFNLGNEIVTGTTSNIADFTRHIPVFGSALSSLASIVDETVNSYRELSSIGAGFGGDLSELRRAAADSGMYLDEYTDFMRNNSQTLAMFGGTVTEGAKRFNQLNTTMKASGNFQSLSNLGFTVTEVNEGMAEYLELQGNLGRLQGRSTRDLASGSAAYMMELDKLSKLTGKSRRELAESMAQDAKKANIQALLAGMTEDQQRQFLGAMQAVELTMPGFKGALEDLADGIAQTPLGERLQALAPQIADAAAALGRGEITQAEFMNRLKTEGGPALLKYIDSLSAAEVQALQNEEGFSELLGSVSELRKFVNSSFNPAAAEAEQAAAKERADKLLAFDNTIREVREKIKIALIDSGIFPLLLETIGMVADGISSIAKAIGGFVEKIAQGDVIGAIGSLFSGAPAIAAVVGGITALFLGKAALGAMARGVGGLMGKLTDSIGSRVGRMFGIGGGPASQTAAAPRGGGGGGGAGFARGAGNAGKGIGNFIGQMGAGIMKGAAAGLAAFANPAILVGAGILAGAIVAIGAGIAGATWLLGNALPSFAEGLKSFADIDGDNLLNVAKGIAGVGAALAAMGAGSAVGAVGNTIANILDALPGKSPLEKLEEFSKLNINAARTEANANAMAAYGRAMAAMGAGGAAGSLGNVVSNIADGLVNFFGGSTELPWDKVKAFGDLQLNTQGIINNAGAVAAYAEAIKDFPQTPAPTLLSSFKTGVAALFGAETDPFAAIREFGNTRLNTQQIISNAGAVAAYAVAIKDFPQTPAPSLLSSFKTGVAALFGAETDPFAPIKAFGDLQLNTQGIIANAYAVAAYALAIKDFPQTPAPDVFSSLKTGIAALFGAETDPFAPLKAFGGMTLDVANIRNNAEALKVFNEAMATMTSGTSATLGDAVKGVVNAIAGWFSSGTEIPYDKIRAFGEARINAEGVRNVASGIIAYSDAMARLSAGAAASSDISFSGLNRASAAAELIVAETIPDFFEAYTEGLNRSNGMSAGSAVQIVDNAVIPFLGALSRLSAAASGISGGESGDTSGAIGVLKELAGLNNDRLMATASGMQAITDSNFGATIQTLQSSLDANAITSYTNAISGLISKLEDLNETLAEDNDSLFGGDKASAGELLNNISLSTSTGTQNSREVIALLQQLLELTMQQTEIDEKIERNTQGFGSNLLTGDVTRY